MIESALSSRLLADTDLTDLISTRLWPMRVRQGADTPHVAFYKVDTLTDHAYNTSDNLVGSRFRFDCFAKEMKVAKTVAEIIRTSLDAYKGTILSETIYGILYLDEFDGYDDDTELFITSIDFRVWHRI